MNTPAAVPEWSDQDADAYRIARDLLTELVIAIDARIDAKPDAADAEALHQRRREYVEEKRTLSVLDQQQTRRIVEEYPPLLSQIRLGEP